MLSLFRPRLPIDADELEWQFATFKWLGQEFGGLDGHDLVLPDAQWFPPDVCEPDRIHDLFLCVKQAAGMQDWPCDLEPGASDRPIHAGNSLLIRHESASAPCGTFQVTGKDGQNRVVISYNPALAGDTTASIATFAHELGHYLMSTARSDPPGGWELHELHTDIAAVYLGFGIFLANSARSFAQHQDAVEMGWSSRLQGYLGEGALVTALAIFERLRGGDPETAVPYLKDYLRSELRRTTKALGKLHPDLSASVQAVDLADYRSESPGG